MKQSQLFTKTRKQIPADAQSINHQLLIKGGFVEQLSAGVYVWLPLGLRVLNKINTVIRDELNAIGAQEVSMPSLISKTNWEKTDRWENVDVLFKTKSQTDKEYGLGFSHEEVVTPLAKEFIASYKDLPLALYQIQTKFRDELRAKSGVLRGREFGMKDLYSFHATEKDFLSYYETVKKTYLTIFKRLGLTHIKITEASGGSFTKKHSHEFNVLTPAGEVDLLYCNACTFAQNTEITSRKVGETCPVCEKGALTLGKAIEVGNIFDLGTKFAQNFDLYFTDKSGQRHLVLMGCYGIGNTRLVGTIVEMSHDDKGIMWPKEVAPFSVHLISLPGGEEKASQLYSELTGHHIDVLWDDRDVSAGQKFADSDLIGIPVRLVVSQKTGVQVEVKHRSKHESQLVDTQQVLELIKK